MPDAFDDYFAAPTANAPAPAAPAKGMDAFDDYFNPTGDKVLAQEPKMNAARAFAQKKFSASNKEILGGILGVGVTQRDVMEGTIPGVAAWQSAKEGKQYQSAQAAYAKGEATDEQMGHIAEYELAKGRSQAMGPGRAAVGAAMSAPAILGEAYVAGPLGRAVAGATGFGGSLLGRAGAQVVEKGATGMALPSLVVPTAQARAEQNGGDWTDAKNLLPAMGIAGAKNVILGTAGGQVASVRGGLVGRAAGGAAVGTVENMVGDAVLSAADNFLPDAYKTNTRYGTFGHMIRGEKDDVWKSLAADATAFGLFSAFHGSEAKPVEAFKEMADDLAKKGYSSQKAAEIIQKDVGGLAEDIKAGRDVTKEIAAIPSEKARDYLQSLADAAKVSEKPSVEPEAPQRPVEPPSEPTAQPAVEGQITRQAKAGEAGPDNLYRVPDYKNSQEGNLGQLRSELLGSSFAKKYFWAGKEHADQAWPEGKFQMEFDKSKFGGEKDTSEVANKVATLGSETPMYLHPALKAIRLFGKESSETYKDAKQLVEIANEERQKAGLDPVHIEAIDRRKAAGAGPGGIDRRNAELTQFVNGTHPIHKETADATRNGIRSGLSPEASESLIRRGEENRFAEDQARPAQDAGIAEGPNAQRIDPQGTQALPAEAGNPAPAGAEARTSANAVRPIEKPLPEVGNNHTRSLSDFGDRMYRETSIADLEDFLPFGRSSSDSPFPQDLFFSRTANLALGQGKNKGVLMQFEPGDAQGKVNTKMPGWEVPYSMGEAELISRSNPSKFKKLLQSFTIKPDAEASKPIRMRMDNLIKAGMAEGWTKEVLPDGSVKYSKPGSETGAKGAAGGEVPITAESGPILRSASPKAEARNPIQPPKPEENLTALAREEVSKDRLLRGEEAVVKAASKSDPELWDAAQKERAQDPTSTDRIVADILSNKPVDPDRAAPHLLQKRIELNNAEKRLLAKPNADPEAARRELQDLRAEMNKVDLAVDRLGSKLGRGLRFYRVLAAEDYTLSGMLGRATVDNKGPLNPDQTKKIEDMAKRIEDLNDRLDLYRNEPVVIPPADTPARSIWDRAKDFLGGLFKLPESKKKDSKAWDWADKLEKNATDELMKRFGPNSLYSGFDPAAIPLLAKYTAAKIVKSGLTFADFSKRITAKFGDEVKPHLDAIWSQAKKLASQPMDQKDHEIAIEKEKENYDNYREEIKRSKYTTGRKVWEGVKETGNVIRLWETAADLSAMLRQGGLYTFGHPIKALTDTLPKMLRSVLSEHQYDRRMYDLKHSKDGIEFMQNGGFLSDPGKMIGKEEAFISKWLSKRPATGDWKNPLKAPLNLAREIVSGSERAYTSFLNEARLELFRTMRDTAFRDGRLTKEEAAGLATFTNDWTGRATLPGQAEKSAAWLANFAFSPRYLWSRVRVLSGANLAGGTMATRKAIGKEYARSAMGLALFYGAVAASNEDAKFEWDTRSSDFGKIRFGNFRLDPLTGLSQLGVFLTRATTGEFKSAETGKTSDIRKPVFELRKPLPKHPKMDMQKLVTNFARTKAAPLPGMTYDVITGTTPGQDTPPTTKGLAAQALVPISVNDVYDAMRDQKFPRSAALSLLAILGMGTQLHEPKVKK